MSTISGISGMGAMPQAMSGASGRMAPQTKMSNLFQQIDTANTGRITKAQFEQAFNNMNPPASFKAIGLDAAFSKLDPAGRGSVSKDDFINGMKSMMTHRRHHNEANVEKTSAPVPQTVPSSTAALNALGGAPDVSNVIGGNISTSA
ncbi:MAG TPA: EF-hand domain-containing protein [Gallionella sp.]|nr:EF-hand domain-containing protein [Gallionella sp.]